MTPKRFRLLILPGDHVGPEIMTEALKILDIVEECCPSLKFDRVTDLVGGCSIDKYGVPIREEVLDEAARCDAVLFGSIGGPEWAKSSPPPETGLLLLRKKLNAFANIRPCQFLAPSLVDASPIKPEIVTGTNFIVVRENCGGAYFGEKEESAERASDLWAYTPSEVQRCARVSAAVARAMGRGENDKSTPAIVWSADKANVLASGRLWRRATQEVFDAEFPDVELRHQLADSMALLMVKNPRGFNGVIHTDNTFGDILSDISGGIVGSLGTLPSASLSGVPGQERCMGIYEPVHGSAPDIAGKGMVNPVAQILSLAMLLRYSCLLEDIATAIEKAVAYAVELKENGGLEIRTRDLAGVASTSEMGQAISNRLRDVLSTEI